MLSRHADIHLTVRAQVENVLNNQFWVSAFSVGFSRLGRALLISLYQKRSETQKTAY
jgi:hypothetical protein